MLQLGIGILQHEGHGLFPERPESGARLMAFDLPPLFVATIHSAGLLVRRIEVIGPDAVSIHACG
jgi:hypothetical protein